MDDDNDPTLELACRFHLYSISKFIQTETRFFLLLHRAFHTSLCRLLRHKRKKMGLLLAGLIGLTFTFGPPPPPPGSGKCCNQYGNRISVLLPLLLSSSQVVLSISTFFPLSPLLPKLTGYEPFPFACLFPLQDFGKNGCGGCSGGEGAWCDASKDVSQAAFDQSWLFWGVGLAVP